MAMNKSGQWNRVTFEERLFQLENNENEFRTEKEVTSSFPVYMLSGKEMMKNIELPSIVFIILPDKISELYGEAKKNSHFELGVPSQVIIAKNYRSQKKVENYLS